MHAGMRGRASERQGEGSGDRGKAQIVVYRDERETNVVREKEKERRRANRCNEERKRETVERQRRSLVRSAARLINTNGMQIKSIVRSFEF